LQIRKEVRRVLNPEPSSDFLLGGYAIMRIAILFGFIFLACCAALGKGFDRQVERGSQLETELGYKLSVHDKHDEWRSESLDETFPIEGPGSEYIVKFRALATGKLNDLSGLTLTVKRADGIIVQVPLAMRSIWNKENEVDVQFLIKKDLINEALLSLRCERRSEAGGSYVIRLKDYVEEINLPQKSLPQKSLMEAVAIAEEFLRSQKIDPSKGVLVWVEFRNYLPNERETPRWDVAWVLGGERVDVWVSQDGSAKLTRVHSSPRTLPANSLPEAVAIGEKFLRGQNIDVSKHTLLRGEFKIYFLNERETPFWEITWALGDKRAIVWVFQDGSTKLIRRA
jgi:hypothetical protein